MRAEIRINDSTNANVPEEENRMLKAMVDKVKGVGANVLLCQKGIDDLAQHYLAKENILAVRRVKEATCQSCPRQLVRGLHNLDDFTQKI
jgi:chaperonin GroEL (HSP60 family)